MCHPSFIARCVEVLDHDPTIVGCHTKTRHIDVEGKVLWDLPDPTEGELGLTASASHTQSRQRIRDASSTSVSQRFSDVLFSDGWSARSEGVFRSQALRRTHMLLPVFGYEKVLMAELALIGRFHDVPETLFFQRIHPQAMSAIATSVERQQIFEPQGPRVSVLPRLRLLAGYMRAVRQADCRLGERLRCMAWISAYLLQVRKWKRVVERTLRGMGTGGEYYETLKKIEQQQGGGIAHDSH